MSEKKHDPLCGSAPIGGSAYRIFGRCNCDLIEQVRADERGEVWLTPYQARIKAENEGEVK